MHGQQNIKTGALVNGIYVVLCTEPSCVVVRMCVKIVSSLSECLSPSDKSATIMKHCWQMDSSDRLYTIVFRLQFMHSVCILFIDAVGAFRKVMFI